MLQLPGQHRRIASVDGRTIVEDLHHRPGTHCEVDKQCRDPVDGTLRCASVVVDNYSDPPSETSDAILAFSAASGKLKWVRQVTSQDAFVVGCPEAPNCPAAKGPDFDFGSS